MGRVDEAEWIVFFDEWLHQRGQEIANKSSSAVRLLALHRYAERVRGAGGEAALES